MKTRFDLEQEILHCWNVVDDIQLINENILERDLTKDEIVNLLTGIHSLYQLKFQTLFETFESCLSNKNI